MLVALCAALAAAIVVIAFLQTWSEYGTLPERVPLNIGLDGTVNRYGPRPFVWLLPAVMLFSTGIFAFSGYAIATHMPGTHGTLAGLAVFAPCVLGVLWRGQALIIAVAKSGGNRVPMGGFLIVCGVLTLIAVYAVSALG